MRVYHMENNLKNGEEYEYQIRKNSREPKPKLLITWYKGKIQGYVKTWYDNGNIESQREMVNNKRNGLATAWYKDGSLMLIEEYDHDFLLKGEYYKKEDRTPVSEITDGNGIVTIYDGEGHFIRRINYYNGKPQDWKERSQERSNLNKKPNHFDSKPEENRLFSLNFGSFSKSP